MTNSTQEGQPNLQPPPLRRQNASRFSWEPDPKQEWCYIGLSPIEFSKNCTRVLKKDVSAQTIAEFFNGPGAAKSRAYAQYAARWRPEIDNLVN